MKHHIASATPSLFPFAWVYVLHAREHLDDCLLHGMPIPGVKLITGMADLADCHGTASSLWIDARTTWCLPGVSMFSSLTPQTDMQVCIYNCEHLAPEVCGFDQPQLRFLKGDIHPGMLESASSLRR